MRVSPVQSLVVFAALFCARIACGAEELPILAKARAYLGSEAALNSVQTIHYTGILVAETPGDATKTTRASVEIYLQKPDRQRVTIASDKAIETTALDVYDGWTRTTAVADPSKWQQTLLSPDQIKRLRANTWENVAFFRGLEKRGGVVQDLGKATVDGIACQKVAFIHNPNVVFYRYFDIATGRVVHSETDAGISIREKGDIVVNGVRFPKSIVTVQKGTGGPQTVTITFDKVVVNEKFPAELFAVPSLAVRR